MKTSNNYSDLATKQDILRLEHRLGGVESKMGGMEEFLHKIMKELQDFRQEQTLLSSLYGSVRDMEDQVEKLLDIHPSNRHTSL